MSEMSIRAMRQDAIDRGARFFSTGKPCSNGHTSKRYASNGGCVECLTPGAGRRALSRFQEQVVKVFVFRALVPVEHTEEDMLQLKLYIATCMQQWEKSKGTPSGMNNWHAKISGELGW
jgi:hypothetical protein